MISVLEPFVTFLVKRVPGRGPAQRESGKTVLYWLIVIIILISYIIIKLLIKRRTISAKTGNGTPPLCLLLKLVVTHSYKKLAFLLMAKVKIIVVNVI
jgi:hypothetical protein